MKSSYFRSYHNRGENRRSRDADKRRVIRFCCIFTHNGLGFKFSINWKKHARKTMSTFFCAFFALNGHNRVRSSIAVLLRWSIFIGVINQPRTWTDRHSAPEDAFWSSTALRGFDRESGNVRFAGNFDIRLPEIRLENENQIRILIRTQNVENECWRQA